MTNSLGATQTYELYYRAGKEEGISDIHGFTQDFFMNISYERSPFQQGATAVAMRGDTRPLSFVIHLVRRNSDEIDLRVQEIIRFMNPYLGELEIIYDNGNRRRMIHAYYVNHNLVEPEESNGYASLSLNLMADSALFEDEFVQTAVLGSSLGTFTIPFTLPIQLGSSVSEVTINNTGDYHHPVEMVFYGPLSDPELIREVYNSDDEVILTDTLTFEGLDIPDNYSLKVNTDQGKEEATLIDDSGNETNVNRYLTVDSNYWQMFVGKNIVTFSSVTGNPVTLLNYKRKYIIA